MNNVELFISKNEKTYANSTIKTSVTEICENETNPG